MNVPKLDAMLRPILALSVDAPITRAAATESMALHFGLSAEDRQARIPSGRSTYVRNRTGWAMTFLTKGGLIVKVAPKQYRITERGRAFLAAHPEEITTRDLEAIDGWEEAWNADTPGDRNTPVKDEPVWNCEEAAVFLRIHPKTVKRLASMGSFPGFRIGNRWRFRPSELDAWAHSAHTLKSLFAPRIEEKLCCGETHTSSAGSKSRNDPEGLRFGFGVSVKNNPMGETRNCRYC